MKKADGKKCSHLFFYIRRQTNEHRDRPPDQKQKLTSFFLNLNFEQTNKKVSAPLSFRSVSNRLRRKPAMFFCFRFFSSNPRCFRSHLRPKKSAFTLNRKSSRKKTLWLLPHFPPISRVDVSFLFLWNNLTPPDIHPPRNSLLALPGHHLIRKSHKTRLTVYVELCLNFFADLG